MPGRNPAPMAPLRQQLQAGCLHVPHLPFLLLLQMEDISEEALLALPFPHRASFIVRDPRGVVAETWIQERGKCGSAGYLVSRSLFFTCACTPWSDIENNINQYQSIIIILIMKKISAVVGLNASHLLLTQADVCNATVEDGTEQASSIFSEKRAAPGGWHSCAQPRALRRKLPSGRA